MEAPRDGGGLAKPREQRKLERLLHQCQDGRELGNRIASSSEATAWLFSSGYHTDSELGEDVHSG